MLSGNVYQQLNDKVFLTSHNRIDRKGRFNHRNDFTTLIDFPKEFYKKHFTFDRGSGIYRSSLKYIDILKYIRVEITHDFKAYSIIGFTDNSYSRPFVNYGIIIDSNIYILCQVVI